MRTRATHLSSLSHSKYNMDFDATPIQTDSNGLPPPTADDIVLNFPIDPRICQLYKTTPYYILLGVESFLLLSTIILATAYLKSFHRMFICLICISTAEVITSQFLTAHACDTQESNWNLILRVTLPYTCTLTLLILPICFLFLEAAEHSGQTLYEGTTIAINCLVFFFCHLIGFNTVEEINFELFPCVLLLTLFVSLLLITQPYLRKKGLDYEESELYRRRKTLNSICRNVYLVLICASPPTFFSIRQDAIFGFDMYMETLRVAVPTLQVGLIFYYVRLYTFAKVPFGLPLLMSRGQVEHSSYPTSSFNPDLCPETHPGAIWLNDLRRPLNSGSNS